MSFYDTRQDPDHPRLGYYHTSSDPGTLTFGPDRIVSNGTFTAFDEPGCGDQETCQEARSLGDYTGIAASEAGVFPVWADGRGDSSRIHAAHLAPAGNAGVSLRPAGP